MKNKITSVKEAKIFVEKTNVDVLAVSVGNVHGFYKGKANIHVDRIKEINEAVQNMPIVMHGGSDIEYDIIKVSILAGIKKFNIATDLKQAYSMSMRKLVGGEKMEIQPLKLFPVVANDLSKVVEDKIKKFNLEE